MPKISSQSNKPLSALLKAIMVILIVNIILSLFSIQRDTFFLFGLILTEAVATILKSLFNIVIPLFLFVTLWKRYAWGWKLGITYYGFLLLNSTIALVSFLLRLPPDSYQFIKFSIITGIIVIIANALFVAIFIKEKHSFTS